MSDESELLPGQEPREGETYIGDGLYAEHDNMTLKLRSRYSDKSVYLNHMYWEKLVEYLQEVVEKESEL